MKELKDYLHLYLGCEVQMEGSTLEKVIVGPTFTRRLTISFLQEYNRDIYRMKLVLRRISDMTDKEKKNSPKAKLDKWGSVTVESMAELINYLRSLIPTPIDCDGLIDAGLAIDKSTLTPDKKK